MFGEITELSMFELLEQKDKNMQAFCIGFFEARTEEQTNA